LVRRDHPRRAGGVSRAALYRTHRALKDEFDRSLHLRQHAGEVPDPREARLAALKQAVESPPIHPVSVAACTANR
jgi:hypothetical protein